MKKSILIISFSLLFVAVAFGDDVSQEFPDTWSTALRAGTERMIGKGLTPDEVFTLTRAMNQAQFDEESILSIQNIVIEAHGKGLPIKPMINKVYEGIAKRVPPPMVQVAMERISERYAFALKNARQLTERESDRSHLGKVLTMGIAAGLKHPDVESIVNRLHHNTRRMKLSDRYALASETLLIARNMARQGVSSGTTAEVIGQALQQGFNVQEMKSMHQTFMSQAPRTSAEHLAKNISKAIQQGKDPQSAMNMGQSGQNSASGGRSGSSGSGGTGGGSSSGGGSGGGGSGGGSGGSGGGGSGGGSGGGAGGGSGGSGGGS